MQSLKLDLVDSQYFLICECGHKTSVEFNNINVDYSKEKSYLKTDFVCQNCEKNTIKILNYN